MASPARRPGLLDAGLPGPSAGAFTLRNGGYSGGPWQELNLGLHVADRLADVEANRELLRDALEDCSLVFAQQVHGRGVAVVDASFSTAPAGVPEVDALVTVTPGLGLAVLAADCLPVLLADVTAGVVAAAHAGRQGLAGGVLQATLAGMRELGALPEQTHAVLGPAVCGACYELPATLADEVGRLVPGSRTTTGQGAPSVDLRAGAAALLRAAGVGRVTHAGGCTVEQPSRFYSYRRDGVTGRHAGVVRLRAAGAGS